ncbi:MAG: DUF2167 domain-containing protein [Methylococcaceae bacterium]|nr:DUF2167 domain-containing protein [Methylococcaceae bacterium]
MIWASAARAEQSAPESAPPTAVESAEQNAFTAASQALKAGPADIPLAGQAILRLPAGYGYVPKAQAASLMESMGNRVGDGLQGMVVPTQQGENADWFVVISYDDSGFIKDDDARTWDADELLNNIRSGTEETNSERRSRGIPEIEVTGWVEKPQYDEANHRLVWSLGSRQKGDTGSGDAGVNYNTLALGREGYLSLNLVTGLAQVEQLKPVARTLLASLDFDQGKRYADFNADTDKVAEYGLAALVAGVAAKKLGMFALAAAFVAKFAKVIGVAVVVGLASLKKLFGGKDKNSSTDQA